MGSSISEMQSLVLAAAFGLLFLLLDATRGMATLLGPMHLRRFAGDKPGSRGSLFPYTAHTFSLIVGTTVQISLVAAVAFTLIGLRSRSLSTLLLTTLAWAATVALWKAVLATVPEELAEKLFKKLLPATRLFYFLYWPLVFPIRWLSDVRSLKKDEDDDEEEVTDEEVQAFIDVGEEEGILEEGEGRLIQSIVDFGDRVAHELMTPRIDMLAVSAEISLQDLAQTFIESKYSRIPVYEGNVDRIIGIVHIKDVFDAHVQRLAKTVRELASPAYVVHETKKVSQLLREFQIEHLQIAVVLDEYGGTAGLITIEDLIEEIVGDIADEHEDEEESVVELPGGGWLVNGHFRVERLEEIAGAELTGEDYETVAGLIFTRTGRVPKAGERVSHNGFVFEVERADRKRIYRVRITPDLTSDDDRDESEGHR